MALTFTLLLNDRMTPRLGASVRAADSAIAQMNQRAASGARNMGTSMDGARQKVEALRQTANSTTDWNIFKQASREANKLEREIERLNNKVNGKGGLANTAKGFLGGQMSALVKPMLAAASVGAVMSFATSSVKAAMDFGATSKSYEVLAGDAGKGKALANNLNKLQQDTILGPEVFKAGQTMMSFGISSEKVMPIMKQLGDVSMGNTQRFEALTLAFSQTQSAGKLMGQDLLQYVNAGFNPLQVMSQKWQQFGFKSQMSVGQLRQAMEKGAITSGMVAKAFEIATSKGGQFADMMTTIGQTSYGKMKVLEGQWESFKINIGNALMPAASGFMEVASKTLNFLNISKSVPETLQGERAEINTLVTSISQMNEKNDTRAKMLNLLVVKYPELFSHIDKETVKNSELLSMLEKVNGAYNKRIGMAATDFALTSYKKDRDSNLEQAQRAEMVAQLLRNGDVEAAKKYKHFFDPRIRSDWSNEDNAKQYDAKAKEYRGAAAEFDTPIKMKEQISFIQKARDTLDRAKMLSSDSSALKKLTPQQQKEFLKEYSYAKGLRGGDQFKYDYTKLDALMQGKPLKDASAADAAKVSAAAEKAMSGQKTITINISKMGVDKFELHANNVTEGVSQLEDKIREMFLRIVNSATGLAAN